MSDNRPEGRKQNAQGGGSGLYRRGGGLNTGPVGRGSGKPGQDAGQGGFRETGGGGNYNGRRGGGKSPIAIIVIALIALLFGGKGGLSGLLGGDGGLSGLLGGGTAQEPSAYVQTTPRPTQKPSAANPAAPAAVSGISQSMLESLLGSSTQSSWSEPANVSTLSETVASGSREKFTKLRGKGKDTVTIMVYMCGTDLEAKGGMATKDLLEMTRATLGDKVNLIVYTGGCTSWRNNAVSDRTNQIYQVTNGQLKSLQSNAGNVSMTDPDTLSDFISFCEKNFPATRNELILWDHGSGSVTGFGYDQKFPTSGSLSLAGIKKALDDAGVYFDFIGFDACLMGTLENGLMLSDRADYLIASEETEPGTGWYYTDWLSALGANTSIPTAELGKRIVDDFVRFCSQSASGQSATLSVVDLAELAHTVPPRFRDFAESISGMIAEKEYREVSAARSNTREFARSTAIDQIDLVHFALNIGNDEGRSLAEAVRGAVKYNRTSSNINNAYGVSIYFPYRKLANVDKAIKTYNAIGIDESYSQCIRDFASIETSGQVASGGSTNPYSSLFGNLDPYGLYGSSGSGYGYGGSSSGASSGSGSYTSPYGSSGGSYSASDSTELISALLNAFLGGDTSSMPGLSSGGTQYLFGRSMPVEDTAEYIAANRFDPTALVWTKSAGGEDVLVMSEEQWALVNALERNVFFDDGEGYLDLGLDNVFAFDESGSLRVPQEIACVTINGQYAAYYHEYTTGSGAERVDTGYVPVLLNGDRAELMLSFDADGNGSVVGARFVYADGETETVAKSFETLSDGDKLDFLCDYYGYDGEYNNTYRLGEQMIVRGEPVVRDAFLPSGGVQILYRFTDLFAQHYWSLPLER